MQEEKQEIEQRRDQEIKQTPEISLRPNTGSKQLEFSLSNFPILSAIPMRNGFESLMNSKLALWIEVELMKLVNEVEFLECEKHE